MSTIMVVLGLLIFITSRKEKESKKIDVDRDPLVAVV